MSSNSYRPNVSGANWRQREIEKAKARKEAELKAKEEAERKQYAKTETNFPSLIRGGATQHVAFDHKFSTLASNWQRADDIEVARQAMEEEKARKARNEVSGMFLPRFRPGRLANMEAEDYEEEAPQPTSRPKVDYEGWEEVKKKAKKQPRELSMAELAKKYEEASNESDDEEADVNSHLYDNRRRGELY